MIFKFSRDGSSYLHSSSSSSDNNPNRPNVDDTTKFPIPPHPILSRDTPTEIYSPLHNLKKTGTENISNEAIQNSVPDQIKPFENLFAASESVDDSSSSSYLLSKGSSHCAHLKCKGIYNIGVSNTLPGTTDDPFPRGIADAFSNTRSAIFLLNPIILISTYMS